MQTIENTKQALADEFNETFTEEQQEVLKSIRISRIILPVLIGVGVVAVMFARQFDMDTFREIEWSNRATLWVVAAFVLLIIRHLAYSARLRTLSEKDFSWRKCIELIFIWEFSSAVSPTSIGGSAVALFIIAQEKLSAARTATIVLYSAVMDTIFFIGVLPILLFFFGSQIIRPGMTNWGDTDAWGITFFGAYIFMFLYGALFFYGLLVNPSAIKRVLVGATHLPFLKRFRKKAQELGEDIIIASKEMARQRWPFHVKVFLFTATAWGCRFILLNCLITAFSPEVVMTFWDQGVLYARLKSMFVIMAFSPTPGGAGFAEIVFYGFLQDYIPNQSLAILIASIWRLMTYYSYLFIGAIIIPNWIRNIMNQRKMAKKDKLDDTSTSETST